MEEQGVGDEELSMEEVKDLPILPEETPHISINAISVVNTYQTMKVEVRVRKNSLCILIDSRSTHNFLDVNAAKKLSCDIRHTLPL